MVNYQRVKQAYIRDRSHFRRHPPGWVSMQMSQFFDVRLIIFREKRKLKREHTDWLYTWFRTHINATYKKDAGSLTLRLQPFIRLFVHSFVRSFVCSLVHSFIHLFVLSFIHPSCWLPLKLQRNWVGSQKWMLENTASTSSMFDDTKFFFT